MSDKNLHSKSGERKMIKDNLKLTGEVNIVVTDKDGNTVDSRTIPNLVVKSGRDFIASRMIGTSKAVMSHMAIGTDNTAAVANNTTLGTEVERNALSSSAVGTGGDENIVTYVATFGPNEPVANAAVVESGIFNDVTSGDMLCRTTFPVVNKGTDDTLTITWAITINAA
jgi:hypothetical protein